MPEPTLAEQLASTAVRTMADGVPVAVQDSVPQRVLDTLGLCVAAQRLPTSQAVIRYVLQQGGTARANAVAIAEPVSASQAAFANGVFAHSLDFDDTHLPSVLHPSASVIPAALAAAQCSRATGAQVVRAIAVGLEVTIRLGMAGYDRETGSSIFFEHGQHATSICGVMGAGVAAALLLGLDERGVCDTIGLTGSMAGGLIESNRTGGTVKRLHCGWAAQSAIAAAELVTHGFTGPPSVLEGRFGFFQAFLHDTGDLAQVTQGLGTEWAVADIFFKPYPANHFTHAAIDAAMAIRARGIGAQDVVSATLGVPTAVVRTVGEPIAVKRTPSTGYQAQFSGPYAVAVGLLGGGGLGVGLDDYSDELARDPERRSLMAMVDVVADARCDAVFPHQFPAILTVRTTDGRELVEQVMANRGGPQRPLSVGELSTKFESNTDGLLSHEAILDVRERVLDLATQPDVNAIMHRLSGAASPLIHITA